jgi:replicative superfamily II helicase
MVSSFDARHPETWLMRLLAQARAVPRTEVFGLLANTYGGYLAARADANWQARFEPQLQALIERMIQTGLVEVDGEKIRLTILGTACGQSPLQLDSALQLVEMIRAMPPAAVTPVALMVLCEALPEMDADYTPLQRGRRGEPNRPAELASRFGHQLAALLQRRAGDDLTYHRRCKRALVLADWLDGRPIDEIERAYSPNAFSRMAHGDIVGFADQARFFLQSALRIAAIIRAGTTFPEEQAQRLLTRLEVGVPEAALPLLELPLTLTRGELMAFVNSGAADVAAVRALPLERLEQLLGRDRGRELHEAMQPA